MEKTLAELAEYVQGTIVGDGTISIAGVAGLDEAGQGEITFLANPKYRPKLEQTQASAAIVAPDVECSGLNLLKVSNPYLAFAQILTLFSQKFHPPAGIHHTCQLGEEVSIGDLCAIGAYVSIGNHVRIGDRTVIYPGVVIGDRVTIGSDVVLYPNVSLLQEVSLGNRVIIHSGTVVGSDGFGFAPVGGQYYKIPQIGSVVIDDDVEIGANVAIDRATLGETHIHRGVKIDNLVQIAHNVVIDEHSVVVSQVGISGSTKVGKHVTLAGQVGLVGHIRIGDHVMIGAQSGVTKSVPEKSILSGSPAVDQRMWKKSQVSLLKLPDALKRIRAMERKIQELEEQLQSLAESGNE
ncbi:UDP-3-O-(3-hydroxymyristoyl)glucosamine N-acyltransferase [candidate division KSB3 bacterium]|uniref:UDP-3-O-acylglucosamine N-acyltransferase n=1 Tax=candidate division KSB3 bacterium TaxID=2044937 RepID=A0A2G6KEX5_9BACT|nr:MAG: UDP-3-O-(3-hydroxymyristoyl)glucosamine N-acyltransferase [candidate division KSB3 bacterium]